MNTTSLFQSLRTLSGSLSQVQVDSTNAILEACNKHAVTDPNHIAYILATAWHESRLKPISEIGYGKGHSYGIPDTVTHQTYYGRGFVQITHKDNYDTFSKVLGVNLVAHPELALQTDYAAEIIVIGMQKGMFTGKRLMDYFNGTGICYPVQARKIINGSDCADLIAGYYSHLLESLK